MFAFCHPHGLSRLGDRNSHVPSRKYFLKYDRRRHTAVVNNGSGPVKHDSFQVLKLSHYRFVLI